MTAKNNLETEFPTFLVFVNEARIGIFQSDTISSHIRQIPKKSQKMFEKLQVNKNRKILKKIVHFVVEEKSISNAGFFCGSGAT